MGIKTEIQDWIKDIGYWFLYASNEILQGKSCDEELIQKSFELFLEDEGLKEQDNVREVINFEVEADDNGQSSDIDQLVSIQNIKNVNALITDQKIELSKNVTVVFGKNGTGKSGYTRLLNNAFKSRGDKDIIGNVHVADENGAPSCEFEVITNGDKTIIEFPENSTHKLFTQFLVFDSTSEKAHITQENNLIFTPSGFEYFEEIMKLTQGVKLKLEHSIASNDKPNEFLQNFPIENEIQTLIGSLNGKTNLEELTAKSQFIEADEKVLEDLIIKKKELEDLNITKKIDFLQKRKEELIKLGEAISKVNSKISKDDIGHYNTLIFSLQEVRKQLKAEGISNLEQYFIDGLGSNEWKEFITSSRRYLTSLESEEIERCLLCLQPLKSKEQELFKSYWKLLSSELQKKEREIVVKLDKLKSDLTTIPEIIFNEGQLLHQYLTINFNEELKHIVSSVNHVSVEKGRVINFLTNKEGEIIPKDFQIDLSHIRNVIKAVDEEKNELIKSNPEKAIKDLNANIRKTNDKKLLTQLLPSIVTWIKKKEFAETAKGLLPKFRTNSITRKQGEFFGRHVTDRYKDLFEEECKYLRAPKLVEINQRNSRGSTLRRLVVAGKNANQVLSEGEQKAISMADFLTEAQLDSDNRGIILDDPVTSLDYERREEIAQRLVEESKNRQVVIFTHDITFLLTLQYHSKNQGVECKETHIRKFQDQVGIIEPNLPYMAQKVKSRIGYLKNYLVEIKKTESSGDIDNYTKQIKSWYGLLREGWERAIEERLLKGVIERFGVSIQSQKLKNLEVTKELIDQINLGMTESSKWLHDSAPGLAPRLPNTDDADQALNILVDFCNKCKPA